MELLDVKAMPDPLAHRDSGANGLQERTFAYVDPVFVIELGGAFYPGSILMNHERRQVFDVALAGGHKRGD